jgi:ribosomal protein S18 acetylase RimI-like enzyme
VLDVGGTVAGYATLGLNRARSLPQEGEIYELYLKPEFQGVGLGKRLFTEARQLLDSLGCKGVVVWCLEDNHRIRRVLPLPGRPRRGRRPRDI